MEDRVALVCGRRIEEVDAAGLRAWMRRYDVVVVDLGTGDGRWLYRLARSHPAVLCLGIDANAGALRDVSYRASRKSARGGLPNVRFIAVPLEALPRGLQTVADEVWVMFPWGSLLRAVLRPEPSLLRGFAGILKPQGVLRVAINESVLGQPSILGKMGIAAHSPQGLYGALRAGYNEAGLTITGCRHGAARVRSSWGGRLGQGADLRTLWVEAVKHGDGRDHGRGRNRAGAAGSGAPGPAARCDRHPAVVPVLRSESREPSPDEQSRGVRGGGSDAPLRRRAESGDYYPRR